MLQVCVDLHFVQTSPQNGNWKSGPSVPPHASRGPVFTASPGLFTGSDLVGPIMALATSSRSHGHDVEASARESSGRERTRESVQRFRLSGLSRFVPWCLTRCWPLVSPWFMCPKKHSMVVSSGIFDID